MFLGDSTVLVLLFACLPLDLNTDYKLDTARRDP